MKTTRSTVYLICGFIGAGKSTFSKKLEEETGALRITKDEWSIRLIGSSPAIDGYAEWDRKITALSREVAFNLAEKGVDVILDEGFWERKTRDEMRKRAELIGVRVVMYFLDTPVELMRERVLARNSSGLGNSFKISGEMFDDYLKYWEPPTSGEEFVLVG